MKFSRIGAAALLLYLCGQSTGVLAQQDEVQLERGRLLEVIRQVESDPDRHAEAMAAGAERAMLCASCHGRDGNSKKEETPNLAGQNPGYILEQLDNFTSGRRKNFVMQPLAARLNSEDRINLALYFSSMAVQPIATDPALHDHGKRIFSSVCFVCHGSDGRGSEGFARIAGQRPDYVMKTLKRYRANARGESDADDIKRTNPRMEQVTQNLSDKDIEALANYVASLRVGQQP